MSCRLSMRHLTGRDAAHARFSGCRRAAAAAPAAACASRQDIAPDLVSGIELIITVGCRLILWVLRRDNGAGSKAALLRTPRTLGQAGRQSRWWASLLGTRTCRRRWSTWMWRSRRAPSGPSSGPQVGGFAAGVGGRLAMVANGVNSLSNLVWIRAALFVDFQA